MYVSLSTSELRVMLALLDMFKLSSDCSKSCIFCESFLLLMFHVCLNYTVMSLPDSLVNTNLLALLCVMFPCVLVN